MKSNAIKDTEPHGLWRSLSSFSGSVWGVDFSGYVYRAMQACDGWHDHATGEITHDCANCNEWIAGRMESLVGNNVRPLLVWDGCALKSKGDHAAAERAEKRETAETKPAAFIDVGGDLESEEGVRLVKALAQRSAEFHAQSRAFFSGKGYLCLTAPGEADAELAGLQLRQITQATLTGDGDLLVFGCPLVVFDVQGKRMQGGLCYTVCMADVANDAVHYDRVEDAAGSDAGSDSETEEELEFDRRMSKLRKRNVLTLLRASGAGTRTRNCQLLCLIAGSDCSPGIKGHGTEKAAKLIFQFAKACAASGTATPLGQEPSISDVVLTPARVAAGLEQHFRLKCDAKNKDRPTGSDWHTQDVRNLE